MSNPNRPPLRQTRKPQTLTGLAPSAFDALAANPTFPSRRCPQATTRLGSPRQADQAHAAPFSFQRRSGPRRAQNHRLRPRLTTLGRIRESEPCRPANNVPSQSAHSNSAQQAPSPMLMARPQRYVRGRSRIFGFSFGEVRSSWQNPTFGLSRFTAQNRQAKTGRGQAEQVIRRYDLFYGSTVTD